MATDRGQLGILAALPGVRASLHWRGWLAIALLVVPAVLLAALAQNGQDFGQTADRGLLLAAAGLLALAATGLLMARALAGMRGLAELAQLLCDRSDEPVFIKDATHRYRFLNGAAAALYGRRIVDMLGRRDSELAPGPQALAYEENDRVCLDRDMPTMFRELQALREGGERVFLISKHPLHDVRSRTTGLLGTARDISDGLELQRLARRRADEQRAWFERNPLPAVVFASASLRILKANGAAERCYGYDRRRLTQMRLPDLFAAGEAGRLATYLGDAGRAIPPGSVAWQQRRANGELFGALTDVGNLPHEEVPARMMMVRDTSAEATLKQAVATCEQRFEDLLEAGLSMAWMHDFDGRVLRVNTALAHALGYEREDLAGRPLSDFIAEDRRQAWSDYMTRARSFRRDAGVLHFVSRSGERRVWQYQIVGYPDAEPTPYVFGAAQDVTLRRRFATRAGDRDQRDELTGARTRQFLDDFAQHAERDQAWGCVVVNVADARSAEEHGDQAKGDERLRELAGLLDRNSATGDIVVRMGDDEFLVLVPSASEYVMRALAERLAAASRDGVDATISVGWAIHDSGEPLKATLQRARIARRDGRA